jgi:hypothetical protein
MSVFLNRTDLDRTNLGNAKIQGLQHDVLHGDPTGRLFDWVNSASVLILLILLDFDTNTAISISLQFLLQLHLGASPRDRLCKEVPA